MGDYKKNFRHYPGWNVPFIPGDKSICMPGTNAINFLLHDVLGGGGVASIRNDPQAKGYSQLLLFAMIPVPRSLAENLPCGKAA